MRAHPRVSPRIFALARRLGAAALLSVLALLAAGTSSAFAGPGVVLEQGGGAETRISGAQIAAAADTGPTSYTDRERPGAKGTQLSLRGVTVRGLLGIAGIDAASVDFVRVVGDDGSVLTLRGAEINGGGFPEGPALFTDEGSTTRFFRPARRSGGTSENVVSAPGTAIEVSVDGGTLLSVSASASPRKIKMGQSVTFRASVRIAPPGAQIRYTWQFGDGTTGSGATVTHRYDVSGDLQAQVKAEASGGSQCPSVCAGVKAVDIQVTGRERKPDEPQGTPDGDGTSSNLGGQGGSGGGTGTGSGSGSGAGAGGGSGSGSDSGGQSASQPNAKAPRKRATRPEPEERFSSDPSSGAGQRVVRGVLLEGVGRTLQGLPDSDAGGSPKPQQGQQGTVSQGPRIGIGAVLAIAFFSLGALSERRRVTLRTA